MYRREFCVLLFSKIRVSFPWNGAVSVFLISGVLPGKLFVNQFWNNFLWMQLRERCKWPKPRSSLQWGLVHCSFCSLAQMKACEIGFFPCDPLVLVCLSQPSQVRQNKGLIGAEIPGCICITAAAQRLMQEDCPLEWWRLPRERQHLSAAWVYSGNLDRIW